MDSTTSDQNSIASNAGNSIFNSLPSPNPALNTVSTTIPKYVAPAPVAKTIVSNPVATQSTTTLSSNKAPDITTAQTTTAKYATGGVTTDPTTGVATDASGAAYTPNKTVKNNVYNQDGSTDVTYTDGTTEKIPSNPSSSSVSSEGITSTGGYVGETYYAPGSTLPVDANGKYPATTATSPSQDQITKTLTDMKTTADALTASNIANIQSQYDTLQKNQQLINSSQNASTQSALFRSGAAQGDAYAQKAQNYQIQQGVDALADLETRKNSAIITAQQAGQAQDFQLQEKLNDQIASIAADQAAAGKALSDTIQAANTKANEAKIQASRDSAVADLYSQGITDVPTMLSYLNGNGGDFTADEVSKTLNNITSQTQNQKDIQAIALEASKSGNASPETIKAILSSVNPTAALLAAGDSLSDTLGNQIKQQQLQKLQLDNAQAISDAQGGGADNVSITNEVTGNPVNIPIDVAPYANTSSSGVMYADLSDIQGTAKEKKGIIDQAQQAGLKVILNKNTAADLVNIKDANSKLDTISGIFAGIDQPGWLARDLAGYGLTKLSSLAQSDPQKAAAGALQSVGLDILKAISGVQGFRGNATVVAQITDHLPKITDTADVVNTKVDYIKQLISDREDAAVGKGSSGGTDTIPKGTDGADYGHPGYVSDGTQWVAK